VIVRNQRKPMREIIDGIFTWGGAYPDMPWNYERVRNPIG
jgi:hypothetical protein